MAYNGLIRLEGEFNYSANIQFDIENDQKLLRFLPSRATIELFKDYFIDITRTVPTCHSRILYGSYGTGKSHFLTVLSLLLSKRFINGTAYDTFKHRIAESDEGLANDIDRFTKDVERKPYLVVPIVFDFDDFDRSIFFSLKKKLDQLGIVVHYPTFYEQAHELVSTWLRNNESKERLLAVASEVGIVPEELIGKLANHDPSSDDLFRRVFSGMSYGGTYVYEASSLSETLDQVHYEIKNQYDGIVFIFDEFGRYLEDNARNIRVKAIQNLSEYCDHNDTNTHIILVSHMEINQYTKKYGKSLANEWKKVEGRFKATPINDRQDQSLTLAANVMMKEPAVWRSFSKRHSAQFAKIQDSLIDFHGFASTRDSSLEICLKCFPLHPITLFALDRLSKKVAQNERTFFTYLSSKDKNSLYDTLQKFSLDEFHFVGIDDIFAYFESNIKAVQSDESYEWYRNLLGALSKLHLTIDVPCAETRILKALTVIGIVGDYGTLPANKQTILRTIDCDQDELIAALDKLCKLKIIKYSGAYERYEYFNASIFDIEKMIAEESRNVSNEAVVKVLNERFVQFVLYPYQYNRRFMINRVFVPVFASEASINYRNVQSHLGEYYDGVIVMLLGSADTDWAGVCDANATIPRSIVVMLQDSAEILCMVKQLIAIDYLDSINERYVQSDPTFAIELQYHKRETTQAIIAAIQAWFELRVQVAVFANGRCLQHVSTTVDMVELASELMDQAYPSTLLVNNELVNKNATSPTISSARKNVIRAMLRGADPASYYDQVYLSPDYIMVRSVLAKNGMIKQLAGIEINRLDTDLQPRDHVLQTLQTYIQQAEAGSVEFGELYRTLKGEPFGLRDGYLPLLLAQVLLPYRKTLNISSHDVDKELSAELFEDIVKRPKEYCFSIARWSSDQLEFLDGLTQLFGGYIDSNQENRNRLKAVYDAMQKHYRGVSKFSRTTTQYVDNSTIDYRKLIEKGSTNYARFIFSQVMKLGGTNASISTIVNAKHCLDSAMSQMLSDVSQEINHLLSADNSESIAMLLRNSYDEGWRTKQQRSFDFYTNAFLDYVQKIVTDKPDSQVIYDLAKLLTGFEPSYWADTHKEQFLERLEEIITKLNAFVLEDVQQVGGIRITYESAVKSQVMVFDEADMSTLGQTMKNKITSTLAYYGRAITYEQKIQVILSVLSELMEGKV